MLVQVKENQPSLLRIIERISRTDTALSSSESFDDKKRSREESRKVDVFDASPTLENTDWDGLIAHSGDRDRVFRCIATSWRVAV